MYLREEGLNVDDPLNSELLAVENQLSAFARRHNNSLPDTDEYNSMLDIAVDAFEEIKVHTELDEKLVSSVLVSIASACVLVLQSDAHVRQWDESRPTD